MQNMTYVSNAKRYLSGLLLVLTPWILLSIITALFAKNSMFMLTPYWNDELSYWHEVLSFSTKGLNFGYYTINEILPNTLSFGNHGFGTVSVYTAYAKLFGWNYYSIAISNNVFISIAFFLLILIVKPTTKTTLLISLFYITYTPLILYCSTSMSELMNFATLIVYFSLLFSYINYDSKRRNIILFILIFFCISISFIRIINIILFLPIIFYYNKDLKFNGKMIILLTGWIIFSIFLFLVNSHFVSPYPYSFLSELFSISTIFDFTIFFLKHLCLNILRFFYPFRDDFIQVLQRYLVFSLIIWLFIKSRVLKYKTSKIDMFYFSAFILIFLSLLITFTAYDVFNWRDYRVITPLIFGIILFFILSNRLQIIKIFFLVNLFGLIILFLSPRIQVEFLTNSHRYTRPKNNVALNKIQYSEKAISKFKNTLVIDNYDEDVFLNTPAGIGITFSDTISDKLQSRYIYTHTPRELKSYQQIIKSKNGILYQKKI